VGGDNKGITLNRLVDIMYIIGSRFGVSRQSTRVHFCEQNSLDPTF